MTCEDCSLDTFEEVPWCVAHYVSRLEAAAVATQQLLKTLEGNQPPDVTRLAPFVPTSVVSLGQLVLSQFAELLHHARVSRDDIAAELARARERLPAAPS